MTLEDRIYSRMNQRPYYPMGREGSAYNMGELFARQVLNQRRNPWMGMMQRFVPPTTYDYSGLQYIPRRYSIDPVYPEPIRYNQYKEPPLDVRFRPTNNPSYNIDPIRPMPDVDPNTYYTIQ